MNLPSRKYNLRYLWTLLLMVCGLSISAGAQTIPKFGIYGPNGLDVTTACQPFLASFIDSSTCNGQPLNYVSIATGGAYDTYTWDIYGDGTSISHYQNPGVPYTTRSGTFNVKLTITCDGVNYVSVSKPLTIYPQPVVKFGVVKPDSVLIGCSPLAVSICDSTVGATQWIWDDGLGGPRNGYNQCFNDTFSYDPISGRYAFTITEIVTNTFGCVNSLTKYDFIQVYRPPIAGFYADNAVACDSPWVMQFHDTSVSQNPLTYLWNFGDGSATSTLKDPAHTYTRSGDYTITLTVKDMTCGMTNTVTKAKYVRIRKSKISFTASADTVCQGTAVNFNAILSGSIDTLKWSFGPVGSDLIGPVSAATRATTYTYPDTGTFTVRLIATDTVGCSHDTSIQIVVKPVPVIAFTASSVTNCIAPFSVTFTPTITGVGGTYYWQFENPSTDTSKTSTQQNPTYEYVTAGNFSVRLTIKGTNGCNATLVQPNLIHIDSRVVTVTTDSTKGCAPVLVHFTDASTSPGDPIIGRSWDFGDPLSGQNTSTLINPQHRYDSVGTYSACLTIHTASGCTGKRCTQIQVGKKPTAAFTAVPNVACVHEGVVITNLSTPNTGTVTYLWDFGDNTNSAIRNPVPHAYDDAGKDTIKLTVRDNGCRADTSVIVTINDPKARFNYNIDCSNAGVGTFRDSSTNATRILWNFGDPTSGANNTSTSLNETHAYATSGVYTVKLIAYNDITGCKDSVTKQITVSLLNINWSASPTKGCAPALVTFTDASVGAGLRYKWTFGDPSSGANNTIQTTNRVVTHTFADSGIYVITLVVSDPNGCSQTMVKNDTISKAKVDFSANPTNSCFIPGGVPVTFSNNSASYLSNFVDQKWDFGDATAIPLGSDTSHAVNPTYVYKNPGLYTVSLTVYDAAQCTYTKTNVNFVRVSKPVAGFTTNFNLYCASQPIAFTNTSTGSGLSYHWDFGDNCNANQDTTSIRSPQYTYTCLGHFPVSLVVTDAVGCKDSLVVPNAITIADPSLAFTAPSTSKFCPPHRVDFRNLVNFDTLRVQSVRWDFGVGSNPSQGTSTLLNPSHIYTVAGHFTVKLVVTFINGCKDSITYPNYVNIGGAVGHITTTGDTGCAPLNVCFKANTTGAAAAHIWYFGDGTAPFSGADTVCHTYKVPAVYHPAVLLIDTQSPPCQYVLPYQDSLFADTVYTKFTVLHDTICEVVPIQFTDSSSSLTHLPIVKWQWDFGDTNALGVHYTDTVQNPVHSFIGYGSMTVRLRAYDALGCFSEYKKLMYIHKRPTALFIPSDTIGCKSVLVTFRDSSLAGDFPVSMWHWDFGNAAQTNDTSNVSNPPPYLYDVTGQYPVTLIVSDVNGCTDTMLQNIGVYPNPTGITGAHNIDLCMLDTLVLQGSPGYAHYDWTPGTWLSDSTIAQPKASPQDTMVYTLVTTDIHGCFTADTITINVNPLPILNVTPRDTFICFGDSIQLNTNSNGVGYLWMPALGINDVNSPTPMVSPPHTLDYTVWVVNAAGCHIVDTSHIQVNVFRGNFAASRVCIGDTTSFVNASTASDLPIIKTQWTFGDINDPVHDTSSLNNPMHYYADSGSYNVQLVISDIHGCSQTITKTARVDIMPIAAAGQDGLICLGSSVQLHSSGGDSVYWTPASYIDNVHSFNPTVYPQATTTYIAHVTNGVCPFDTAAVHVTVQPTPDLVLHEDVAILLGTSIQLTPADDSSWFKPGSEVITWSPPDSLSCTNCASPVARPSATTTYTATVVDTFGCTNHKAVTVTVNSNCSPDQVFVGNGFTPNNDGVNDKAFARLYGLKGLKTFRIFDRWGYMVFETKDPSIGWDGKTKKGEQLNSGVYVYVVEAECFSGETITKTGNVTLIK